MCASLALLVGLAFPDLASGDEPVSFARDVRPILSEHCFACHGPDEATREGNLRLDRSEDAFADRGDYAAVVPGAPGDSEVLFRVTDDVEPMPPAEQGDALTPAEIGTLSRWIEAGAAWEEHWSLVPPVRPAVPEVGDGGWPANDVDRFVLARLEGEGVAPSPDADDVTLVRRLSFDLRGLPPTPEEVDAYAGDSALGAWSRLVDRFLASPHHGERMAQTWLDLVRYGDSGGYHSDNPIPMSPYRDWVIRAFNGNLPFDRFTVEQLAGDLLPDATTQQAVASGYNRLNKTTEEGGAQPGEYLAKYMADRVRTTAGVWLGLTFGCAECHDHKFDPVSTREFYAFGAFFADVEEVGVYEHMGSRRPPELRAPSAAEEREIALLEQWAAGLRAEGDLEAAARLLERATAIAEGAPRTLVTVAVDPRAVRVLRRGNWLDDSGAAVEPGVPACLPPLGAEGRRATRLDLARWLVRDEHPLTARVHVNRLWRMLFGAGLAIPLDDLGAQGSPPSHPELLDWLARELVDSGWDQRHVLRLLATSRAYRQASLPRTDLAERDPANRLLARQNRWRLDAEHVRDAALAIAGLLDPRVGGKSVFPYQPDGYWDHLNFPRRTWRASEGHDQHRRGLYTHWQRTFPHPSLLAFDAPTREECTAQRPVSNTPLQALVLLNDPTYVEAARVFAESVLVEGGDDDLARIEWAFRKAVQREPTPDESAVLVGLLDRHHLAGWTAVSRTLLNLDETITRP